MFILFICNGNFSFNSTSAFVVVVSWPLSLIQNYAAVQNIPGAEGTLACTVELGKLRLVAVRRFRLLMEVAKGQLISKTIYGVIDSPKK